MNQYAAENIRNIGLLAHGGAGKTSLAEAFLFSSKTITRLGKVEDGNTTTDFDPDEARRQMSISLAVAPIEWDQTKINVIDAPGYADLVGEAISALAAADTALIVLDASAGVEVGSETAWSLAEDLELPRILFVNKMDRENANFSQSIESAASVFGPSVAPVQVPIGSERDFRGIFDLIRQTAYFFDGDNPGQFTEGPPPSELADDIARYRQILLEAVAENNEDLMMQYLEDDDITDEQLIAALHDCVGAGSVTPVLCGAATTLKGIPQLLDFIVTSGAPASERTVPATIDGEKGTLVADPDGPLAAVIFKTVADPHVGRLSYFRVLSGTLRSNSSVYNASTETDERIGHLFFVRGKDHLDTDRVVAGDIGAVSKLNDSHTGDTLCAEGHALTVERIAFPHPNYGAAIHPHAKADLDKLGQALQRIVEEDPTLTVSRDTVTGETILSGLGEPHIQIAIDRMTRRYGVNVDASLPRVHYRETIGAKATSEYKHKKQTGGAGQYGHVWIELEPASDVDFEFAERVVGGSVPRNFYAAVEKGVREGLEAGPLAGYPVVNLRATLFDGSYHPVDSNEMAFKLAAKEALKKGILMAKPTLLEPMMTLQVNVPDSFTGDVMSDLNSKRGQVSGMTPGDDGHTTIEAIVPAAEMQRYATDLRSITQGRGVFDVEYAHHQPVPEHLAEAIKAEAKEREEAHV